MRFSTAACALCALLVFQGAALSRDSRPKGKEGRLADFLFLWEEIDRKHPAELFKAKGVDWAAVRRDFEPLAAKAENDEELVKLCYEALGRLRDGHAWLDCKSVAPERLFDPAARMNPGAGLIEGEGGVVAVLTVYPKSPAAKAGLERGAVILSVDGVPAAEAVEKAAKERWDLGYVSSERAARHAAVWTLLSGRKDSLVKVEYDPGDGRARKASLQRSFDQLLRCPKLGDYPEPAGALTEGVCTSARIGNGFGYLYIHKFSGGDGGKASIEKALSSLPGLRGLVVDVRGNGGGGVPDLEFPRDLPLVLLIDPGTFSAAEGFAAWFCITRANPKGHPDLTLAGQATAGSSSEKATVEVPSGLFRFNFLIRGRKGSINCGPGGMIEYYGVSPHVKIAMDPADLRKGEDTFLKKALEILEKKAGK